MPLSRAGGEYPHIEFAREPEYEPERRRRPNRAPRRIPGRERHQHADALRAEVDQASLEIGAARERHGIDPARLIVLEFESVNFDPREAFEVRFGAWVVEERAVKQDGDTRYRLLVQFPDADAVERFQAEIDSYRAEDGATTALPPALRRDFFGGLQSVAAPSRDDRVGARLTAEGVPDSPSFLLDVDLWHPGNAVHAQAALRDLRELCARYGGQLLEDLRTGSLLLAKLRATPALLDALLDHDAVARVDLPALFSDPYIGALLEDTPAPTASPAADDDPLACVLDSGVVAGHPLLRGWVLDEVDFDTGERTPVDQNGHGTAVAGRVVYGDVHECLTTGRWAPGVRICSAKVMRHDPGLGGPGRVVFPEEHRVEGVLEEAIRHMHRVHGCRVFNMSVGNEDEIYGGGRQFALAEKLDQLATELDIVIVVSAGNCTAPEIPGEARTRDEFQQAIAHILRAGTQRVCNPATASLAMTVGAVARTDALAGPDPGRPGVRDAMAGSPAGAPAPFTRTGPGYGSSDTKCAVKPEVVHFGGNYALRAFGGTPRWETNHILLGEPSIRRESGGRYVGTNIGTSFAAPGVTHLAAKVELALLETLGRQPSANLIRAAVASSTDFPPCAPEWLGSEEERLRVVGYGLPSETRGLWSSEGRVLLVADSDIVEDTLHFYRVPIPESFTSGRGRRGITVALAFSPPVRASRKEYLARTMWFDLVHGQTADDLQRVRGRYTGEDEPGVPTGATVDLRPTKTATMWSTLQVRRKSWKTAPRFRVLEGAEEPELYLLVGCQSRFPTGLDPRQPYSVVVTLWHEGERVTLYQALRAAVRVPAVRIRARSST